MKLTTTFALGALFILGSAAVPGCDGGKKDATAEPKKAESKKPEAKAEDAKAGDAKVGDAKAEDTKADGADAAKAEVTTIGVPECDDYISTMSACFETDEIPADIRDGQKMGFDATVTSWADSAKAHPEGDATLVTGCKAAMNMAKKMYPGCFKAG